MAQQADLDDEGVNWRISAGFPASSSPGVDAQMVTRWMAPPPGHPWPKACQCGLVPHSNHHLRCSTSALPPLPHLAPPPPPPPPAGSGAPRARCTCHLHATSPSACSLARIEAPQPPRPRVAASAAGCCGCSIVGSARMVPGWACSTGAWQVGAMMHACLLAPSGSCTTHTASNPAGNRALQQGAACARACRQVRRGRRRCGKSRDHRSKGAHASQQHA